MINLLIISLAVSLGNCP